MLYTASIVLLHVVYIVSIFGIGYYFGKKKVAKSTEEVSRV